MAKKKKSESDAPIDIVISEIDEKYGEGTLSFGGTYIDVEAMSTGILSVDVATGCGGIPRGRVIEVYGNEASGKTTFALQCIGNCQKSGGKAVFIDAEHALDPNWAKRNGVNMDKLGLSQPSSGDEALNIVKLLVEHDGACDMIVVDSVAALIPKSELEGEIGDANVAAQARLMAQAMRHLAGAMSKSRTSVIFINQLREKIGGFSGGFGTPEATPGGRALKFYASMRIELKKANVIKTSGNDGKPIGALARVKIVKNKVAPPFQATTFTIYFGSKFQEDPIYGIDKDLATVEGASAVDALEIRGSNYYFEGEKLANGKDNVVSILRSNPKLSEKIYAKALTLIKPKVEAVDTKDSVGDIPDTMVDTDGI